MESQINLEQSPNSRSWLLLTLVILVPIAAGAVYLIGFHHKNPETNAADLSYQYSSYDTYNLTGPSAGNGMSFEKPVELSEVSKDNSQVTLMHSWSAGDLAGVTYMAAASQPAGISLNASNLANLSKTLNRPTSESYKNFVKVTDKFVKDRLVSGWLTTISSAKPFASSNIQQSGWSFNFTSSYQSSKVQGKLIFAAGREDYYYLLIYSNAHDWQANLKTWQRVIDSLKIDQ